MSTRGEHLVLGDRGFATGGGTIARLTAPAFSKVLDAIDRRLVVGGIDAQAGIPASNVLVEELYDPVSATWVAAGTSTVGSIANSVTLLRDGTVLVASGDFLPAQTPVDTVERFAGGDCR